MVTAAEEVQKKVNNVWEMVMSEAQIYHGAVGQASPSPSQSEHAEHDDKDYGETGAKLAQPVDADNLWSLGHVPNTVETPDKDKDLDNVMDTYMAKP